MEKQENKKIAIIADNYKVERFIKELTKAGFTQVEVKIYKDELSVISIEAPASKKSEIEKLARKVEFHFKRGN